MTIDLLVVFGTRDPHGASPAEALAAEARSRGLRAETVGALDGAPAAMRALYMRTAALLERLPSASRALPGGSIARVTRERLASTLLQVVAARRPRVIVATDPLARRLLASVLDGRIGVPKIVDATGLPLAPRACHEVPALSARGPRAPRRVLVAAADLDADEMRATIRSFTRTIGVELDVHTGLDAERAAFAEHELDVALVAHARATGSTIAERLAACDLVVGRASPALVAASMAAGRAFLALPARGAAERAETERLLRAEAGLRAEAPSAGALAAKTVDFAFAARLGANGRRASNLAALDGLFADLDRALRGRDAA